MAQRFVACDREQSFLMPPDVRDWLPENHLAWFVIGAVAEMNLDAFFAAYRVDGRSRPPYDPAMVGWIQLVVATLNVEELRCREETPLWIVRLRQGSAARGVRLLGGESIGSGSGRRSLEGCRANAPPWRRVSCRALVSAGSARVAEWRLSRSRRYPGAICPSTSGRRSRFFSLVVVGCERSRVSWVAHRRRSPGSCSETLRCGPVGLSIEPRPRRPMLTAARGAPSRRSLRSTWSCGAMCRIGSPGLCGGPMGASRVRRSAGAGGVTARERTGVGDSAGARNRSPLDYRLTSLMMSRCVSPMRRSTSRCTCRDAERCAGS